MEPLHVPTLTLALSPLRVEGIGTWRRWWCSRNVFEFFQDGEFVAAEHGFGAIIEAHLVGVLRVGGRLRNHADGSRRNQRATAIGCRHCLPADAIGVVARHDARAGGEDEVNRVAHRQLSAGCFSDGAIGIMWFVKMVNECQRLIFIRSFAC